MYKWLLFLIIALGSSCTDDAVEVEPELDEPGEVEEPSLYFPPLSGEEWEAYPDTSLDWCPEKLEALQAYLASTNTKAFIILKNGKIAVEWYFDGFAQHDTWYWASAGKSLTAFLIGVAQQEGALRVDEKTSAYLGTGWTSLAPEQEDAITLAHQMSMTTGLDDALGNNNCTTPECLQYLSDAGQRWAYHNAPYNLLRNVLEAATGTTLAAFTNSRLSEKTGIDGEWVVREHDNVFFSTARSMARFGLLMLNKGSWENNAILSDTTYYQQMISSSQSQNPSYGYLWWLNGKGRHMLPSIRTDFETDLVPNAPDDMYAALGLNDQKLYIVPSQQLVVVRMGNSADRSALALSSFDNELWGKINELSCE